ncbi:MAG: penicillin-binding transpeptidase domain-containing protein [Candidatus Pacebacteria bacterium]|nr:penicillin-binding transpeptidase domain-containing protein [Candidatus Paceibacterota bacterium]
MKDYKVKTQFKEILEPEEILLDTKERKNKEKGKLELPIQNGVFFVVFSVFILLFLLLLFRTVYFVSAKGEEMSEAAVENYLRKVYTEAPRGIIYSKDKKVLVKNAKDEEAKSTEKKKEKKYYRNYIDSFYFSFILGYEREATEEDLKGDTDYYEPGDWVGKDGVEKEYEKYLRGKKGVREKVVNAKGKIVSDKVKKEPEIGDSLVLNIDAGLQKKIYRELKRKSSGNDAVGIALNPQNGAVLALVSIPSNDNNVFSKKSLSASYLRNLQKRGSIYNINKAISGRFPSGSIIKPLIASAALEEEVVSSQTTINCTGEVIIPNPWYPEKPTIKKDNKTHGLTDLEKAIAESCNVFFFTVGGGYQDIKGLGMSKIKKYLDLFYIEDELGIDLPGEIAGFVPSKDWFEKKMKKQMRRNWSISDVYDASIGQGFFSSPPLHMAVALSAIANGGKIYQPQVADKIETSKGKVLKDIKPKILQKDFISKENIKIVKDAMKSCVTSSSGSCRQLNSLPVSSAGKTGTAESDRGDLTHAWFVSFAPYEKPEIFLLIFVEYGGGGSDVAEPIAREVLEWYFKDKK